MAVKVFSVVGARPNFMKIAPFVRAIEAHNRSVGCGDGDRLSATDAVPAPRSRVDHVLVHTGQHYDARMSTAFFEGLGIPRPDIDLGIGSGTDAEQVGKTMMAFEKVLDESRPDWVVVVGDVNATCACSLTAKKAGVNLAHIEAGLRSFDLSMPEEINRMVTDRLADLFFTTDEIASENLRAEGVPRERIHLTGNIMIDTLDAHRERAAGLNTRDVVRTNLLPASAEDAGVDLADGRYAVVTVHRPSNVDEPGVLSSLAAFFVEEVAPDFPLVWPVHPRAEKQLRAYGLWEKLANAPRVLLLHPVGYEEMLRLNMGAALMLTDSGGLQEECCVLGTPCMTLRWNTERPVTLRDHGGVSVLVGNDVANLRAAYAHLGNRPRTPCRPPLWDGCTADRILGVLTAAD